MSQLRVLYLTPPARRGAALAAQSFVGEEIRAMRQRDVIPFVLTDEIQGRAGIDGVELVGVRHGSIRALPGPALMGMRHVALINRVLRASHRWRDVVHALRIEDAAACLVVRERIDVVHSHFGWPAGFGGSIAAAATGTPLVTSVRGTDVLVRDEIGYGLRLDPGYDVAIRHLFRTASRILTATPFMHTATLALGASPLKVQVIDKGVDTTSFHPAADRQSAKAALGLDGPVLLAVGSLTRRKGFDVVIDALAALRRRDVMLILCGDGDEQHALRGRAETLGLAAQVRFDGQVSRARMPDYFRAADIFVHAAELEAAGNVVLEALASGCATVVTDSGGPAEYVEDGVNGFVVPVADAETLTSRIAILLSDPALRSRLGTDGRRRVERRHRYARMVADLRRVYEQVRRPARDSHQRAS